MKPNSYKFFANSTCVYYPCHQGVKGDFNCLFCFCPLYFLEDCGGNFRKGSDVKDCSDCTIPHGDHGYEHIIRKIREANEQRKLTSTGTKPNETKGKQT